MLGINDGLRPMYLCILYLMKQYFPGTHSYYQMLTFLKKKRPCTKIEWVGTRGILFINKILIESPAHCRANYFNDDIKYQYF